MSWDLENWKNKLYFGDNLEIMRDHIADETIDLIYLDPPFNSSATYNVLFEEKNGTKSGAQITAFEDTWHWGKEPEQAYHEIVTHGPKKLSDLVQALRSFLGSNDMMAYLTMMAPRLAEMYRILKTTGSIYLHCDPTASHYIKLILDAIFGYKNFVNELIWHYATGGASKRHFSRKHDIIFFYSKTDDYKFYPERIKVPRTEKALERARNPKGARIEAEDKLKLPEDVLNIQALNPMAVERLGYPTQKPEKLLECLIKASSDEGDVVLDPFCGCGTSIAVAERFNRKWIGIDITHIAITLMKNRLEDTFGKELSIYSVIGDPKDLNSAKALAEENRYQFEWWALGKVGARPAQDKKKGSDKGIDGYIYFFDDASETKAKKIVVQVKSGHVGVNQIRDLKGVMEREKAEIGAFITLKEPTKPMKTEALAKGFYEPEIYNGKRSFQRIQILTIKEILEGKQLEYPKLGIGTFKKAKRKMKGNEGQQMSF